MGSQGGDTGGAAGSRGGDTEGAIGSRQETREVPSDRKEETQEAPGVPKEETKGIARLAIGSTYLGGPVVPARRKLTISGIFPPNNVIAHVESTGARRREGAAPSFLPTNEEGDEKSVSMCDGGGAMILQRKVEIPEPTARGMSPKQ